MVVRTHLPEDDMGPAVGNAVLNYAPELAVDLECEVMAT